MIDELYEQALEHQAKRDEMIAREKLSDNPVNYVEIHIWTDEDAVIKDGEYSIILSSFIGQIELDTWDPRCLYVSVQVAVEMAQEEEVRVLFIRLLTRVLRIILKTVALIKYRNLTVRAGRFIRKQNGYVSGTKIADL